MFKRVINHLITLKEKKLGRPLRHVREIASESESAFLKIALAAWVTRSNHALPKTAFHLAALVATQQEDCGDCTEIATRLAESNDVPAHYLRAALSEEYHLLPPPLEEICGLTRALVQGREDEKARSAVRARYGVKGLTELGLVIAAARLFPTIKRALGEETSRCLRPMQTELQLT